MRKIVLKAKVKTFTNLSCASLIEQLIRMCMQAGKQHLLIPLFSMLLISSVVYANTTDDGVTATENEITCMETDWSDTPVQHTVDAAKTSSIHIEKKTQKPVQVAQMGFFTSFRIFLVSRFSSWFAEGKSEIVKETNEGVSSLKTNSMMMACPGGTAPTVTAFSLSASCTNEIPNNDAYLQISAAIDATHYDFNEGGTYTGAGFASATSFNPATDLPLQFGALANPAVATDYTIRVFNGSDACFTDIVVTLEPQTDCAGGCDCKEMIYLNEPLSGAAVHKFLVNPDNSFTEIGNPWYDNDITGEEVSSPHGLGTDLNGFLYIAEHFESADIRRFNCDGELYPESDFLIDGGNDLFNISSIENTLYHNTAANPIGEIIAHDLCTTDQVGGVNFCENPGRDWGLYINTETVEFYATTGFGADNYFWYFNASDFDNDPNTCVSAIPLGGNFPTTNADVRGVVTDADDNVYIAVREDNNYTSTASYLLKYGPAPDFNYIGMSAIDSIPDGTGFHEIIGLVYSETNNLIYASTSSSVDDCVSIFDTNLNYLGAAAPATGNGNAAKGIAIQKECCPTNNRQRIDQTYCISDTSALTFLNEVYECEGVICEGLWEVFSIDPTITYDDCNQTISLTGASGCATFVKSSDGVGNNLQCGAFEITLSVCFYQEVEATAFALSPSCTNGIPNDDGYLQISAAIDATHYDFTAGSTYTGAGMADATAFNSATDLPLQFGTLANPALATDYTIRVFNGSDACFTDLVVTLEPQTDCETGCDCEEMVYLNEPSSGGAIHKFKVNSDSTFTEIGSPWFNNTDNGEQVTTPHGITVDLNGNIYVGETLYLGSEIRKFTCDGEIFPESEFGITADGQFNFASIGNSLYSNNGLEFNSDPGNGVITERDLCTGQVTSSLEFCDNLGGGIDWALHLDSKTNEFYATAGFGGTTNNFWYFSAEDFDNDPNTCVSAIPLGGDFPTTNADVRGMTTDSDGNVYIAVFNDQNTAPASSYLMKFGPAPTFNYIGRSALDTAEDGTGYRYIIGLVYSETTNLIYASTYSQVDDCVSTFDTDLNYLGVTVPSPGTGDQGKGIAITKECCPTSNRQVIDQTYCISDTSALTFLNEVYECEGVICEGLWEVVSIDPTVTYNDCSQAVTLNGAGGCATFVKSSDGIGNNLQCGAFEITLNVCFVVQSDAPEITVTENICNPNTPGAFSVTTACGTGSTIEWSTDNGTTWSTTTPTYTNANAQTVIARCVDNVDNTCLSAESAAVTSSPNDCCPVPNCFGIGIQQN